jgi:hypothetical protein
MYRRQKRGKRRKYQRLKRIFRYTPAHPQKSNYLSGKEEYPRRTLTEDNFTMCRFRKFTITFLALGVSSLFVNVMAQKAVVVLGAGVTGFSVGRFNTGFNINTTVLGSPNKFLALGGMLALHFISQNHLNIQRGIDKNGTPWETITNEKDQTYLIDLAPLIRFLIPVTPEFEFHIEAGPHLCYGIVPFAANENLGFWGATVGAGFSLYQFQITPQYRISYSNGSFPNWWTLNIGYNFIRTKKKEV